MLYFYRIVTLSAIVYFLLSGVPLFSQSAVLPELQKKELELRVYTDSITKGSSATVRESALAAFNPLFFDLLNDPRSFHYPFDSLKTVSMITASDGRMRIYTWMIRSLQDGTYRYFGVVQQKDEKNNTIRRTGLTEMKMENDTAEQLELLPDAWYGAIYYEVIAKRINKQNYYFLLGWHGNDRYTTRKVIDVMHIDQWNNINFGAPLFRYDDKTVKHRIVFEYSADAVMTLRYVRKKKAIVFDHLSPVNASAKGQYRYYGPDFTHDGFFFKRGMFIYRKHLDLRNEK